MASVLTDLHAFVERAEQWQQWGVSDCILWPADWVLQATGRDPAAGVRGAYSDGAGARRVIRAAGGLVDLVTAAMAREGFALTDQGRPGDVGLVRVRPRIVVGAIRFGNWWVALGANGVLADDFPAVAAWRILD